MYEWKVDRWNGENEDGSNEWIVGFDVVLARTFREACASLANACEVNRCNPYNFRVNTRGCRVGPPQYDEV